MRSRSGALQKVSKIFRVEEYIKNGKAFNIISYLEQSARFRFFAFIYLRSVLLSADVNTICASYVINKSVAVFSL